MMFFVSVLLILVLLLINELWFRKYKKHGELSRKVIHILVGSFVAFLPYIMSYNLIRLLSVLFVVVILLSIRFKIFKSIHNVDRNSIGEIMFGVTVGLVTFIASSHLVYTISILAMSLSDGVAALIGTYYGKSNRYKIFGRTKSLLGSLTFFTITLILTLIYVSRSNHSFNLWYLALCLGLTVVENISPTGLDNLFIPVVMAMFLA